MEKKVYVITFDTPYGGTSALHTAIDNSPKILAWWHYINNTYLVVSTERATVLHNSLKNNVGDVNFLIIEAKRNGSRQGWLPDKAWKWINDNLGVAY